jgi:hypothetical protein
MPNMSDIHFAKLFGQQALEYWLYKKTPECDFIGCTTYRRYLLIAEASNNTHSRMKAEPIADIIDSLSSDVQRDAAVLYLQSADVITNRASVIASTIENQYLASQPAPYWNLMMRAIEVMYPEYKPHMLWFRNYNCINFDTTYIMRREVFLKYAREYFSILEYVFQNAEVVVPDEVPHIMDQHYRYPGYLGERFFPFFIYANALRRIDVPLIILDRAA